MSETKEIIGVFHEGREIRERVIDYIDAKYPDLESLMIEIPPGIDHNRIYLPFFSDIALYYQEKGVRIVEGDRKYWELRGIQPEEIFEMSEEEYDRYLEHQDKNISWLNLWAYLNGKLVRNRNIDMNEVLQEESPEVCLVGGEHGRYLKKQNPQVPFSFFRNAKLKYKLPTWYVSKTADSVHNIRVENDGDFDPRKREEYRKSLVKVLGSGAVTAGLMLAMDQGVPFYVVFPLSALPGIYLGNNVGGAINYFRAIGSRINSS